MRALRRRRPNPDEGMLEPVLVDHSGRGGSTLMMQILATSPHIAMHREYAFEHYYFRYLQAWSGVPGLHEWDRERWSAAALKAPASGSLADGLIGPMPWPGRDLVPEGLDLSRALFRAAWREFSRQAAQRTTERFGQPVHLYAEKCGGTRKLEGLGFVRTRVLALVRDPRDVWLSIRAFNAKRGYHGFGMREGEPEHAYLDRFLDGQKHQLAWSAELAAGDTTSVFHYEQLAGDLPGQVERLSGWLGVGLDADAVIRARGGLEHHLTTDSLAASAHRWRREMSVETRELFAERLGPELRAHGYEP